MIQTPMPAISHGFIVLPSTGLPPLIMPTARDTRLLTHPP
jgi:hypothetical protein